MDTDRKWDQVAGYSWGYKVRVRVRVAVRVGSAPVAAAPKREPVKINFSQVSCRQAW